MKKPPPWKLISPKIIYQNNFLKLRVDKVINPAGKPDTFSWVERGPFVIIIAQDKNKKLFMVNNYRYPPQKYSLEFPMGFVDKNEPIFQAAKRELKEEVSITAKTWKKIGQFSLGPGFTEQQGYTFLATNLTAGKPHHDPIEKLEIVKHTQKEIVQRIKSGAIHDGPTIISFHFFLNLKS